MDGTSVEKTLNTLYVKAWAVVEDLTLADIPEGDPARTQIDRFVRAVRESHDTLKSDGYAGAWEPISEMCAGFIGLCRLKDQLLPHVDPNLSRECAEAYRSLPDPTESQVSFDPELLQTLNVVRMEQAYAGESRYIQPVSVFKPGPSDI